MSKIIYAVATENNRRVGSHGRLSLAIILAAGPAGISVADFKAQGGRMLDVHWDATPDTTSPPLIAVRIRDEAEVIAERKRFADELAAARADISEDGVSSIAQKRRAKAQERIAKASSSAS